MTDCELCRLASRSAEDSAEDGAEDSAEHSAEHSAARTAAYGANRRTFLAQAVLAAAGLAVTAACGDGEIGGPLGPGTAPPLGDALVVRLADFPALGVVGGSARVDAGTQRPIAVTRTGQSSFVALSMICPHAAFRPIQITGAGFRCPNHGAEFDELGSWTGGQRTSNLLAYTAVYDANAGTLTIT